MSRNPTVHEPKIDRRVRRTRDRLGDALVVLLHEKPLNSVTVQEILDRAGVARSTFYSHYRDKEDLFVSDVDDFWSHVASLPPWTEAPTHRVAPVRELFAHVAEMRPFWAALVESGRLQEVLELGEGHLARSMETRLVAHRGARALSKENRAATAHALAGALIALLTWWIHRGMPDPPEAMDDLFHRLVWTGVGAPAASDP